MAKYKLVIAVGHLGSMAVIEYQYEDRLIQRFFDVKWICVKTIIDPKYHQGLTRLWGAGVQGLTLIGICKISKYS